MRILSTASALAAAAVQSTIEVGRGDSTSGELAQYLPTSVTASNGSIVRFRFSGGPSSHRVTQSSFSSPCAPLRGGFDSGWIAGPEGINSGFSEWNLTIVDDSEPIWFYCKQLAPIPQCKAGMVGSINTPTSGSNTFSAFQNVAKSSSGNPNIRQGEGALVDQGASAPAGPLSDRVTHISIPKSPSAVPASAAPSSNPSTGDTTYWAANKPTIILAALFCAAFANAAGYVALGGLIFWLA